MNTSPSRFLRRRRSPVLLALLGATLTVAPVATAAAAPTAPAVKTSTATGVTYQSANLTGSVNPQGQPTTYFFQYGTTTRYGGQSNPVSVAGQTRAIGVTSPVAGLAPVTKYHYRLIAVNATGTAIGADGAFTTTAIPLSLAIGGLPSPVVFGAPLSVVGALSGTGAASRPVILQENPFPFTAGFTNVGNPALTFANGGFQFNLISLAQTTQFRVVSVGAGAPVVSPVLTEEVGLAVSMHVRTTRTRSGTYSLRFSGLVRPAEPGGRVLIQRLVGSQWRTVTATNARATAGGASSYLSTVHRRHGGFFRVLAAPVEGGHIANSSPPLLVHAGRGL